MDSAWKRPERSEYPKLWHTFTAFEEEYRIEDLPESMTEKAIEFMVKNHCDEPISAAYKLYEDEDSVNEFKASWRSIIKQKSALVCFKEGSNEIVGIAMNCVVSREFRQLCRACLYRNFDQFKRYKTLKRAEGIVYILFEDINPFEHYKVDEFLTAAGLCV